MRNTSSLKDSKMLEKWGPNQWCTLVVLCVKSGGTRLKVIAVKSMNLRHISADCSISQQALTITKQNAISHGILNHWEKAWLHLYFTAHQKGIMTVSGNLYSSNLHKNCCIHYNLQMFFIPLTNAYSLVKHEKL